MRIRTIKPEFWQNRPLAGLGDFSRLLALALLNWCDDEGWFLADPALIRGALFPFEDTTVRIQPALSELSRIGFITLHESSLSHHVGHIQNFTKHQRINRPTRSKLAITLPEPSVSTHPPLTHGSGTGKGKGNMEGEGEEEPAAAGAIIIATAGADSQNSEPAQINLQPPSDASQPEKKEGAALDPDVGVWWSAESKQAVQALNRALGRHENRALTPEESAAFARYAAQWDGDVGENRLILLGRYLLAEPRYDQFALADKVPEGSLLRLRKQHLPRVFADLPNQADLALRYATEGATEKKKGAGTSAEPDGDWRAVAEAKLNIVPAVPWLVLLPRMQADIHAAIAALTPAEREQWNFPQ